MIREYIMGSPSNYSQQNKHLPRENHIELRSFLMATMIECYGKGLVQFVYWF